MASHVIESTATSLFAQAVRAWAGFQTRRAARWADTARRDRIARELATYTDRDLQDLGISRDNIPDIIAGTFRRA